MGYEVAQWIECTTYDNAQISKMCGKIEGNGFTQSLGKLNNIILNMKRTPLEIEWGT